MSRTMRWLLFVAVLLLAAALRLWHLDQTPPGFYRDESVEGVEAWRILTDSTYRPLFLPANSGVLVFNVYANALMFGLFRAVGGEVGPLAMRLTAVWFGLLGVIAVYGLANELQKLDHLTAPHLPLQSATDKRQAATSSVTHSWVFPIFAMAALAGMRWHIHFSRMGIETILVPVLWAGASWSLLHGWRTGRWWSFVSCGVLLATAMYAYQGAWVIPLVTALVAGYLLLLGIGARRWAKASNPPHPFARLTKNHWTGLVLTALVAVLLLAPLAWFAWQHTDLLLLRPARLSLSGGVHGDEVESLWHNTWATLKVFGPFGTPGDPQPRRNIPGAPALNLWLAIPFYLGLAVTLWRIRRPSYFILIVGLLGLLSPGMLSQEAPHFHRVLGAAAPTALLCGIGLDQIWQWRPGRRYQLQWAVLVLLGLGTLISARDYFVLWATQPDLHTEFNVGLWEVSQQIATLPPDQQVYMTPRDTDHPTLEFALLTHQRPRPVEFDGRYIFPFTDQANAQPEWYVIFTHHSARTAALISQIFPTASVQQFRDFTGELFAQIYRRPPAIQPQRFPQYPLAQPIGDGILLQGYDLLSPSVRPGAPLDLQIHWRVITPPTANWKVHLRLVRTTNGSAPQIVAEYKNRPGHNSLLTNQWRAGWRILDDYRLKVPANLPAGNYALDINLFQLSGETLPTVRLHTFAMTAKP